MFKQEKKHTVDVLFVITLFCVFAVSIVVATTLGAKVYKNIVDDMDNNFNSRTSYSYIINKIHQSDSNGLISVGTYDGYDSLDISEEINNIMYSTHLYCYNGSLMELFARSDQDFDPSFGTELFKLDSFSVIPVTDHLIKFEFTPAGGDVETLFVHLRSNAQ